MRLLRVDFSFSSEFLLDDGLPNSLADSPRLPTGLVANLQEVKYMGSEANIKVISYSLTADPVCGQDGRVVTRRLSVTRLNGPAVSRDFPREANNFGTVDVLEGERVLVGLRHLDGAPTPNVSAELNIEIVGEDLTPGEPVGLKAEQVGTYMATLEEAEKIAGHETGSPVAAESTSPYVEPAALEVATEVSGDPSAADAAPAIDAPAVAEASAEVAPVAEKGVQTEEQAAESSSEELLD